MGIKKIFLSITATLFCSCLFFASCENSIDDIKEITTKQIEVEEGKNIISYLSIGGKLKAKLSTPYMLKKEGDTLLTEFPKTLKVTFYNDTSHQPESFLFARYAKYLMRESKVFLRDSVIFTNVRGDTMKTAELWWDQVEEELYTDKPIWFFQKEPYSMVQGSSFWATQNFTSYTFTNVQKSKLAVEAEELP